MAQPECQERRRERCQAPPVTQTPGQDSPRGRLVESQGFPPPSTPQSNPLRLPRLLLPSLLALVPSFPALLLLFLPVPFPRLLGLALLAPYFLQVCITSPGTCSSRGLLPPSLASHKSPESSRHVLYSVVQAGLGFSKVHLRVAKLASWCLLGLSLIGVPFLDRRHVCPSTSSWCVCMRGISLGSERLACRGTAYRSAAYSVQT